MPNCCDCNATTIEADGLAGETGVETGPMRLGVRDIVAVLAARGHLRYGATAVSLLEHSLQCAHLAEIEGAPPALVTAGFLHDLGHLLSDVQAGAGECSLDDVHEYVLMPILRPHFGDDVLSPIRMHLYARRYLYGVHPDRWQTLPDATRRGLERQGGPLSRTEGEKFIVKPYAASAVRLAHWNEIAVRPDAKTPRIAHFVRIMMTCAR